MRVPRRGITSVVVVTATILVVGGVDAWVADATARGAEELSANALRSVELAHDMRWQLSRLAPSSTAVSCRSRPRGSGHGLGLASVEQANPDGPELHRGGVGP